MKERVQNDLDSVTRTHRVEVEHSRAAIFRLEVPDQIRGQHQRLSLSSN